MTAKVYDPTSSIGARILKVQSLKAQIDALEQQLDAEKAYLHGHVTRQGLQGVKCGATTLTVRERASWAYSDAVKTAEAKLKARKQREQNDGTAVNTPSEHLLVTISAKALVAIQLQEV
jgi:capsule polysaccharide export protein KpsE/RkpR